MSLNIYSEEIIVGHDLHARPLTEIAEIAMQLREESELEVLLLQDDETVSASSLMEMMIFADSHLKQGKKAVVKVSGNYSHEELRDYSQEIIKVLTRYEN
jgi:phosphotransferase system HPr-like phosphotransfer protein